MKRILILVVACGIVLGIATQSQANLTVVGSGTIVGGDGNAYQLIYDSALNVTWYDYTNLGSYSNGYYQGLQWQNAVNWASNLTVNFNGNNITGWRLPSTLDSNLSTGYNITDIKDEMSYLYYVELGNKGAIGTDGKAQSGFGLVNNPFSRLFSTYYFSGTPIPPILTMRGHSIFTMAINSRKLRVIAHLL